MVALTDPISWMRKQKQRGAAMCLPSQIAGGSLTPEHLQSLGYIPTLWGDICSALPLHFDHQREDVLFLPPFFER